MTTDRPGARQKILVSACLMGDPVRYDAGHKRLLDERLARWQRQGRLVVVCPEVAGGLPTPRPPAEIRGGTAAEIRGGTAAEIRGVGGAEVLAGNARIIESTGGDATDAFVLGAELALGVAQRHGCRLALLTEASPSCGSREIYAGRFDGTRRPGEGVTTALLRAHGIEVFSPDQLDGLSRRLDEIEAVSGGA
ncbi:DUF523 domain-containing protein [Halomonas sp. V046]|uniref:DUF523 domain-containing protein n=1 Tax=Halomonas sp. V046 TaxID=3459611 RepID=UPI0040442F4A